MSFRKLVPLPQGTPVLVVVSQDTEERLSTTCFRGYRLKCAGNFHRWRFSPELLRDGAVREALVRNLNELILDQDFGVHSLTINYGHWVGWAGTAPLGHFQPGDLEQFEPNRKSVALRVKLDRTDLLAPKTKKFTLVFDFKIERKDTVAVIHSIYPGQDVGLLKGDVTERERVVFFDWNHLGA